MGRPLRALSHSAVTAADPASTQRGAKLADILLDEFGSSIFKVPPLDSFIGFIGLHGARYRFKLRIANSKSVINTVATPNGRRA